MPIDTKRTPEPRLPLTNIRAFMPTLEAAEAELDAALDNPEVVHDNASVLQAFAKYDAVVELAIAALHEDTKDRNSLSTLQASYRGCTRFSCVLRTKWLRDTP